MSGQDADELLKSDSSNVDVLALRAQAQFATGNISSALVDINQILAFDPQNKIALDLRKRESESFKARGNAAMEASDFLSAIDLYSFSIEIDPTNYAAYNNRSLAFLQERNYSKAEGDASVVSAFAGSRLPESLQLFKKALYRRSMARYQAAVEMKSRAKALAALEDLNVVCGLDANNPQAAELSKEIADFLSIQLDESCCNINPVENALPGKAVRCHTPVPEPPKTLYE
jgi:tetratricopeptide (TPR) repeat protein